MKCLLFSSENWSHFRDRFDRWTGDSIRLSLSLMDCHGGLPQTSPMEKMYVEKTSQKDKYTTIHSLMEKNAKTIDCFWAVFVSAVYRWNLIFFSPSLAYHLVPARACRCISPEHPPPLQRLPVYDRSRNHNLIQELQPALTEELVCKWGKLGLLSH